MTSSLCLRKFALSVADLISACQRAHRFFPFACGLISDDAHFKSSLSELDEYALCVDVLKNSTITMCILCAQVVQDILSNLYYLFVFNMDPFQNAMIARLTVIRFLIA